MRRTSLWIIMAGIILAVQAAAAAPAINDRPTSVTRAVHIHLRGVLVETPIQDPLGLMGSEMTALRDLVGRVERAREDREVSAVILTLDNFTAGAGQIEELRQGLLELRESGKLVFLHADMLGNGEYLLASAADYISLQPTGLVLLVGLYGESLYLRDLLGKIGAQAEIIQVGDYKSAGEMFTRTEPSPEAAENINWLFDSLYESFVGMIAEGRGLEPERVRELIDGGPYTEAEAAEVGLIDGVEQRDEFLAVVRERIGGRVIFDNRYREDRPGAGVDLNHPFAFFNIFSQMMKPAPRPTQPTIGVIHVEGAIMPGYRRSSPFMTSTGAFAGDIRHALERAAREDAIKGVVLRVDSPGGSAIASETILNAARATAAKKPVIVSMGNLAASGGYYVAMAGEEIFADRMTLTASIGVIGGKLITTGTWDKLGINWVPYARGAHAGIFSSQEGFTPGERERVSTLMQEIYARFEGHVVQGRGDRLTRPIGELTGGRVFSGAQALELGLIDRIGGLEMAIERTAERAGISEYEVRVLPEPLNPIEMLFGDLAGAGRERPSDVRLGGGAAQEVALSLFEGLDPIRSRAAADALARLQLLGTESVLMVMPQVISIR